MPSHFSSVRKPAGPPTGSGTVLGKKKSTSGDSKIEEFGVKQFVSIFNWKLHCRCPVIGLLESRTSATFARYSVHSGQSSYLLYVRLSISDQSFHFHAIICHPLPLPLCIVLQYWPSARASMFIDLANQIHWYRRYLGWTLADINSHYKLEII